MVHSNSHIRANLSKITIIKSLANLATIGIGALMQKKSKAARTRRALADLTPDERQDIGYEELVRKPVIPIEAGLMTKLMSMR